ncbi:head-tail joining protein [Roseivivax marinus]|uniref:head-tail joining protein n=1 Tax=Roseivivax marinus TaxID=1379903 RepID=UPI00273FC6E2|nr:hypothetical protein [Roseivivax marinus]
MDPFALAVDASFERMGIDGILDPDVTARPVKLLPQRPDEFVDVGSFSVQAESGLYHVRPMDMAGFGKGAILEIAGARRRVQSAPRSSDPRRLKLLLNTVAV